MKSPRKSENVERGGVVGLLWMLSTRPPEYLAAIAYSAAIPPLFRAIPRYSAAVDTLARCQILYVCRKTHTTTAYASLYNDRVTTIL